MSNTQPSGIRGSYHNTADITMRVLRENRESLLAVLEGAACPQRFCDGQS